MLIGFRARTIVSPQIAAAVWTAIFLAIVMFSFTAAAEPAPPHLARLGTSVEARIVSLAHTDLPKTDIDFDILFGIINKLNANMIFLEVLDDAGYMIYPSKVWPHQEQTDRLQELIDRAHAMNIHVVPWIKTFFAAGYGRPGPVLEQHPEWAAKGSDGNIFTYYDLAWFNPAHPEARAYILQAIMELVTDYDIDGLQLDYIRYPNTYPTPVPTLYSYDDYSLALFQAETGIDPADLRTPSFQQLTDGGATLQRFSPQWQQWTVWRENQITSFVQNIVTETRVVRPDFPLFFGVIPALWNGTTYPYARFFLNQNWGDWVAADYVDGLTPPAYTDEDDVLIREVTNVRRIANEQAPGERTLIYPSLMVYPDPKILVREIELARSMGLPGVRLFSWGRLKLDHYRALWDGPFARPALVPHEKPFASALSLINEMLALAEQPPADGSDPAALRAFAQTLLPLQHHLNEVAQRYQPGTQHRLAGLTAAEGTELQKAITITIINVSDNWADQLSPPFYDGIMKTLLATEQLINYGVNLEQRAVNHQAAP